MGNCVPEKERLKRNFHIEAKSLMKYINQDDKDRSSLISYHASTQESQNQYKIIMNQKKSKQSRSIIKKQTTYYNLCTQRSSNQGFTQRHSLGNYLGDNDIQFQKMRITYNSIEQHQKQRRLKSEEKEYTRKSG